MERAIRSFRAAPRSERREDTLELIGRALDAHRFEEDHAESSKRFMDATRAVIADFVRRVGLDTAEASGIRRRALAHVGSLCTVAEVREVANRLDGQVGSTPVGGRAFDAPLVKEDVTVMLFDRMSNASPGDARQLLPELIGRVDQDSSLFENPDYAGHLYVLMVGSSLVSDRVFKQSLLDFLKRNPPGAGLGEELQRTEFVYENALREIEKRLVSAER